LLYSGENLPEKHWGHFYSMGACNLKTAGGWAIKEYPGNFWKYRRRTWAGRFWKKWYFWAGHFWLQLVEKAAKTLRNRFYGILNYIQYHITKARVEKLNSQIETVWESACCFRNKKRFRTAILSHLGRLDLFPSTH